MGELFRIFICTLCLCLFLCNYVESKFDGDERGAWLIRIGSQWRIFVLYIRFNVGVFVENVGQKRIFYSFLITLNSMTLIYSFTATLYM